MPKTLNQHHLEPVRCVLVHGYTRQRHGSGNPITATSIGVFIAIFTPRFFFFILHGPGLS